jgi:hypothetical protein
MSSSTAKCIQDYIENKHYGGLISISDLADYCTKSEGAIYRDLISLKQSGAIEIVKRYFCPEGHSISVEDLPHCQECDFNYSDLYISTMVYIKPLTPIKS